MIYYENSYIQLYHDSCLSVLDQLETESVDLIFADPPYFLSSEKGFTCKAGKRTSVNKGSWDLKKTLTQIHGFNQTWLSLCQRVLKKNGTLWCSGTHHNIYSCGFALQELGYKLLNNITWEKPNPPPNLSCRYFTHSTETLLWAAKSKQSKHYFDYSHMKLENENKQMKDVWRFTAPRKEEKKFGKHPTQKPLVLLERILMASAQEEAIVLDPFNGSGTTGVAVKKLNETYGKKLSYIGIEKEKEWLDLTLLRLGCRENE